MSSILQRFYKLRISTQENSLKFICFIQFLYLYFEKETKFLTFSENDATKRLMTSFNPNYQDYTFLTPVYGLEGNYLKGIK